MNRVYPFSRGATGRLLCDLAEAFAQEGWHVTVISSGSKAGEERRNGVRIIRVKASDKPMGFLSYMLIWAKMFIIALQLKPRNVLVTLSDPPLLIVAGRIVAKFKKSHHVNWCQDLYPDIIPALGIKMPDFLMKMFRAMRINAMKSCDKIVVCGHCMKKHLETDGIDPQKIKVITNWADKELIDSCIADKFNKNDTKLKALGKKTNKEMVRPFEEQVKNEKRFQVLYAGNIGLAHPIDVILDAAKILQEQGSDVEFVFVGDGLRFDYIAQRRAEMCLDNIRLLPYQPASRLRAVMEGGDIHLITMSDAAKGMLVPCKTYAALAVARPCIFVGPKDSEVAKVINDFGAGLIVAQDDAENLVNAILYFRKSRDAWFEAHSGAKRAREVFTPKASIDEWIKVAGSV